MKGVLQHHQLAQRRLLGLGGTAQLHLELLLAHGAYEYQHPIGWIVFFVKGKVMSASRAGESFHNLIFHHPGRFEVLVLAAQFAGSLVGFLLGRIG